MGRRHGSRPRVRGRVVTTCDHCDHCGDGIEESDCQHAEQPTCVTCNRCRECMAEYAEDWNTELATAGWKGEL